MRTSAPELTDRGPNANDRGHYLAGVGLLLMVGPLIGILSAIYAVMPDYAGLEEDRSAASVELVRRLGLSMTTMMWGFGAAVLGSALVTIAVLVLGNREAWVYRYGIILAVVLCLSFGVLGVIFGVGIILVLASRRGEFLRTKTEP